MPEAKIYATGKRKTAVARVWIAPGTGLYTINGRTSDDYFVRETNRMIMRQSLELLEVADQFDVIATVAGGGHSAQAEAVRARLRHPYRESFLGLRPGFVCIVFTPES